MALGATIYVFKIELADSDRGVYESLEVRVARHPSEAPDYLIARVLAYCLVGLIERTFQLLADCIELGADAI